MRRTCRAVGRAVEREEAKERACAALRCAERPNLLDVRVGPREASRAWREAGAEVRRFGSKEAKAVYFF